MEFLKKNYMKIIIASLLSVAAVLVLVLLAMFKMGYHGEGNMPTVITGGDADTLNALSYLFTYLAMFIFFAGSAAVVIMSMFAPTKCASKWAMLGVAIASTIFMIVSIGCALGSETTATLQQAIKDVPTKGEIAEMISATTGGAISAADVPTNAATAETYATYVANAKASKDALCYMYYSRVVSLLTYLVIFGLAPLAFAIRKLLRCCCKKHEAVAPVAPAPKK